MTRPGRRRRADSRYTEQAGRLAEWLRDRRIQAGMSQEQLAGRAQVAVATVRKIEKGVVIEPGYFTVLALMHALGATREDMTGLGPNIPTAQTAAWPPARSGRRRTVRRTQCVPGLNPTDLGAGERDRAADLPFTRSVLIGCIRASCTDGTGDRTDSTDCAGIILRVVPRTVPR